MVQQATNIPHAINITVPIEVTTPVAYVNLDFVINNTVGATFKDKRESDVRTERYKHFKHDVNWIVLPTGTQAITEFDIPGITSSENELAKLAEKRNLKIFFQIREGAPRPIIRVMRQVVPFENFVVLDDLRKKMFRSFTSMNITCTRAHTALIIPPDEFKFHRDLFSGVSNFSATATFKRINNESYSLFDFIPIIGANEGNRSQHMLQVYRDKVDPEDIWKLKYSARPEYTADNLKLPTQQFLSNIQRLKPEKIEYRLKIG